MGLFDHDLRNDIKKYREYHQYLIDECKNYVQDTTIDLDERWKFFINDAIGVGNQSWIWHPKDKELDDHLTKIYRNMYKERHMTIYLPEFIEDYLQGGRLTKTIYDRFREAMMEEYIDSFEYDW